jgi:hypothetical protein
MKSLNVKALFKLSVIIWKTGDNASSRGQQGIRKGFKRNVYCLSGPLVIQFFETIYESKKKRKWHFGSRDILTMNQG